jgi:hypothetical protein
MSRLFVTGWELQSVTAGVECTAVAGTPAISTAILRSGLASMRCNGMVSGTAKGMRFSHVAPANNGPFWFRVYFRVDTAPSAANMIIQANDTNAFTTQICSIELNNDRTLQLRDEDGTIGSVSAAIPLNDFEHYIELKVDLTGGAGAHIVEGRLDGVVFATSSTRSLSAGILLFNCGANLNAEAQTAGDWYFDDLAINNSAAGGTQTAYPGSGKLAFLSPTGDSSVAWARGGIDSGVNATQLGEVPPNDVTDYVSSNTAEQIDLYTLSNTPAVMGPNDVINWVGPGVRCAVDDTTGADPDITIGLSVAGNIDQSPAIDVNTATYFTNINNGNQLNYPVIGNDSNYEVPGTASAWTKADLDAALYRLREAATDTHFARVSAVWVYVDYTPVKTRFYLPSTGAADVSPSFDGGWEETVDADRREMVTAKISSAMTSKTVTTLLSVGDTLVRQYVSNPLNAVTITANVKLYARVLEALATVDAVSRIVLKVVSNDGSAVTGTLLAIADYGGGTEFNTSLRNKAFADGDTPSSVSAASGDRLCLEIGFNHAAVISSADFSFGDDSATDLAENETGTVADNPWLDIGQTLTFVSAGRTTKNTDPRPLGIFAGISRRFNTAQLFIREKIKGLLERNSWDETFTLGKERRFGPV